MEKKIFPITFILKHFATLNLLVSCQICICLLVCFSKITVTPLFQNYTVAKHLKRSFYRYLTR